MSDTNNSLPKWLANRRYCRINDLMKLFEVSRATIDRWHRENPAFPRKHKFGNPFNENCSTRFIVTELNAYVARIEMNRAVWTKQFDPVDSSLRQEASECSGANNMPPM